MFLEVLETESTKILQRVFCFVLFFWMRAEEEDRVDRSWVDGGHRSGEDRYVVERTRRSSKAGFSSLRASSLASTSPPIP